jgi:murein DD-endopeptidase MepM/ murein hydrolase activator NlpD
MSNREISLEGQPSAGAAKKQVCFWFMAPGSAKAKRVSCPLGAAFCGVVVFAAVVGLVGFALGDYARIQVNKARNYFHLTTLTRERAELLRANTELKLKLENLSDSSSRTETIEQGLKARLDELASVVGSLKTIDPSIETPKVSEPLSAPTGLGALTAPGAKARFSQEGIGGAEIECEGNPAGCVSLGLADSELKLEPTSYTDGLHNLTPNLEGIDRSAMGPEMVEALDHYIELLKSLPVSSPAFGRVSSGFGFRRSPFSGGISAHEGVDFSLPKGSHVFATGDGIVREVRWNPTYGLVVDIEHSPRIVTRYAHLSKAFVTEGERVCRGETIALSGSTGRATGPHLHYEVIVDGKARNPDKLLSAGTKLAALF